MKKLTEKGRVCRWLTKWKQKKVSRVAANFAQADWLMTRGKYLAEITGRKGKVFDWQAEKGKY